MWNLKYNINELFRNRVIDAENRLVAAKREEEWRKDGLRVSRCKLLCKERIINKGLLHSTANYIRCCVISHNGKEYEKEYI